MGVSETKESRHRIMVYSLMLCLQMYNKKALALCIKAFSIRSMQWAVIFEEVSAGWEILQENSM